MLYIYYTDNNYVIYNSNSFIPLSLKIGKISPPPHTYSDQSSKRVLGIEGMEDKELQALGVVFDNYFCSKGDAKQYRDEEGVAFVKTGKYKQLVSLLNEEKEVFGLYGELLETLSNPTTNPSILLSKLGTLFGIKFIQFHGKPYYHIPDKLNFRLDMVGNKGYYEGDWSAKTQYEQENRLGNTRNALIPFGEKTSSTVLSHILESASYGLPEQFKYIIRYLENAKKLKGKNFQLTNLKEIGCTFTTTILGKHSNSFSLEEDELIDELFKNTNTDFSIDVPLFIQGKIDKYGLMDKMVWLFSSFHYMDN